MFSWLLRMPPAGVRAGQLLPGLLLCAALAGLATTAAMWGGSSVVWALLAGIAIASVRRPATRLMGGIDFAGKQILRLGVALLGLQISAAAFHVLSLASVTALIANIAILLVAAWYLGPVIG